MEAVTRSNNEPNRDKRFLSTLKPYWRKTVYSIADSAEMTSDERFLEVAWILAPQEPGFIRYIAWFKHAGKIGSFQVHKYIGKT